MIDKKESKKCYGAEMAHTMFYRLEHRFLAIHGKMTGKKLKKEFTKLRPDLKIRDDSLSNH